jgi:hypothetical protein
MSRDLLWIGTINAGERENNRMIVIAQICFFPEKIRRN